MIKRVSGLVTTLVIAIFGLLILTQYVAFAAWFIPAVIALVIVVRRRSSFSAAMPILGFGLLLTGFWAQMLLRHGESFPNWTKLLLALPLQPRDGIPQAGRFDPGPWSGTDLIGYTVLASIAGVLLMLYWGALELTSRVSTNREIRVWAFRIAVTLITAGGTLLAWALKTGLHVAFGFVADFFALAVLMNKTDPAAELKT